MIAPRLSGRATRIFCALLTLGVILQTPGAAFAAGEDPVRPLVFGFLPIVSPEKLVRRFEPLVDHLTETLGVPIVLETAPDYAEFLRRTHEDKRYDFLFTAPHFYYLAQREAGYRVVARVDGPLMKAVIVARRDSEIAAPEDLCGRRISTPDALALGTLLVRARLVDAGCDPDGDTTLVATPSHNASLYSAYRGASDAAGLMTTPLARADPNVTVEMRIVAETQSTPNMPFSVAPWVGAPRAEAFAGALVALSTTEKGLALLKHLGWPGLTPTGAEEYDVFERFSKVVADQ
ncbi:MAG: phosphate/phosphite/phosphonate ABC transporter substrate-binding protein [Rhodospirillales bacterium]|nr:phosphate/phosphite/phosphonate ABC transporter substrate-binding protein [Rhodospirillales bacterium]MDH3791914.1 phosphate/phosphite/phosphonate ABC transporter substrate-binding protein [Rhodospirillales bacterium]MDH3912022.1 phosphate/phosphite/phosphonate ABC transporter substrate-binding protein [Rhodospirillales bacterium]MDH3966632.1 phosphate/phosphite/phosphonate ABC transporter substrate-binding protein [Rhodospirillales bacterium]